MRPRSASISGAFIALLLFAVAAGSVSGCVSKSTAQAQARAAYFAGQRDAIAKMQQQHAEGGSVTFTGPVNNPVVPWTEGLTLAKAIVSAGYNSSTDPIAIVIHRNGEEIQIDPTRVLHGEDFPLLSGDRVQFYLPPQ
jgi:hypothetical protein